MRQTLYVNSDSRERYVRLCVIRIRSGGASETVNTTYNFKSVLYFWKFKYCYLVGVHITQRLQCFVVGWIVDCANYCSNRWIWIYIINRISGASIVSIPFKRESVSKVGNVMDKFGEHS